MPTSDAAETSRIDFSVIVPVRNRPLEIRRCVASIYAVDYDPTRFEVIVVDNGSTDETGRAAAESGARVVAEMQPDRCRARNAGARVARSRWLAFTDSDCEVDPQWLRALKQAEETAERAGGAEKLGALAGAILPGEANSPVEAYIAERRWLDQEKFLTDGRRFSPPFAATANLAVRADVFREVGGFDSAMAPAEDADWCWRARAAGWNLRYVPDAAVVHHHRAALGAMLEQAYGYGIGNANLFAKYRGEFGARSWIEGERYIWAVKGLIKSPFDAAFGRTPLERRMAWYDFLTNAAQSAGRVRGALRHRMLIL